MTRIEMVETLQRVILQMMEDGYHYPNDELCGIAEVLRELGGVDYFIVWEPEGQGDE